MENFDAYLDELKSKADIVEIIGIDEPLQREGRSWRGRHNHSLQVTPDVGLWRDWGEGNLGGDVIRWLEVRHKLDFKSAVEELARRVGLHPPEWRHEDAKTRLAAQARYDVFEVALAFFKRKLRECPAAARYCKRRGWGGEVARDEQLGYFDGDYDGLRAAFKLHGIDIASPCAVALGGFRGDVLGWGRRHDIDLEGKAWISKGYIPGIPKHSLVFAHVEFGRVRYFSTRSVCLVREETDAFVVWDARSDEETRYPFGNDEERQAARDAARKQGKRHYNLPRELVGDRQPCWNSTAIPGRGDLVIVEGQADKVTLAQWNIPAVALAGCGLDDTPPGRKLLHQLAEAQRKGGTLFIGTDNDDAGGRGARKLAEIFGPLVRVLQWPDHDANDWLVNAPEDATPEAAAALLTAAEPYLLIWAKAIGAQPDYEKPAQLEALFGSMARALNEAEAAVYRKPVADAAGITVGTFDRLLATKRGAEGQDDEEEETFITFSTVGGYVDDHLVEMLYVQPDDQPANSVVLQGGETAFAIRFPDGHIETRKTFEHDGRRFVPLSPETPFLREGVVLFAPRAGPLLKTAELVQRIQALVHKYVDVGGFYESLAAYYVLFSWFYDVFPTVPYLRVKGDAGSGKTRFLEVVGSLCYRPTIMNAGASVSAMFRIMEIIRGTLVLDEGDFAKSDESADIAKLLNVGNQRRQGRISRSGSKESGFETEFYNVYGPKVISTRKQYDDNAIETRCLTYEMGAPTARRDIPRNLPDTFWTEEVPELQALLLSYRLAHWSAKVNEREIPIDEAIEPRLQQVTDSLKKMIDDPKLAQELTSFIHQYNSAMISERGLEMEAKILDALYILWETQQDKDEKEKDYSMATIAAAANDLIEFENGLPIEQWSRYRRTKGRNKSLSARGAGACVKKLQLKNHRPNADTRRRRHVIWDHERIEGLWQRYGLGGNKERLALMATYWEIQRITEEHETKIKAALNIPPAYRA